MDREDINILVTKWWEIYNDESLDYKPENALTATDEDTNFSRTSSIMATMPEPRMAYIPAPSAA